MPLSDRHRLTIPSFRPKDELDHERNLTELDRWANDLPIFTPFVLNEDGDTANINTTTYSNLPYTLDFTKRDERTDLFVQAVVTAAVSGASIVQIGVQIGNTDYRIGKQVFLAPTDLPIVGMRRIDGSALRPGVYTARLRARISTGTLSQSSNDFVSLSILEVPAED